MYGLLLENLAEYIKVNYGEEKWDDIRRQAGIDSPSFSVHQVYPENLLNTLAKKAQQVLGVSEKEFMDQMGVCFVGFVGQYGYDRVLSVLGRHMRDFLNGLDNLHEYLKFSYPRMKAPSFICENETKQGLTLHYRSKRRGFVYYTMGQIREVARHFYHKDMHIELVREEILFDTVHVTFQLTFDNRAFTLASLAMIREEKHLPISASILFEIFPFCIVFSSDMIVRSIGNSLMVILPDLVGTKITNKFELVRPLIAFKFQTILNRTNNIFELVTVEPVPDQQGDQKVQFIINETEGDDEKNLRLKGQMIYMENWRMIMFLGTPVMPDLTALINTGLYINDLSMHDFSRDLMLAGTQQSVELKLALDQEQQKSKKLEESMRKLDDEMRRTDELLYQMIPKQVADRLRRGENPIDTCEMFDSVSILFSDVVTFTEICSRISPMEVVSMLNGMYSIFDTLTERNNVYKVETIGDAYMVVSGAPEKDFNHAEKVCDMALDMVEAITDLKDPSTGTHLRIRVGVHSGAVVAGIVGLKMPRYCLFGDSVNTASRMESTSTAMKVHISQTTKDLLGPNYKLTERGDIEVKGKGKMKTYWLEDREYRSKITSQILKISTISPPITKIATTQSTSLIPVSSASSSSSAAAAAAAASSALTSANTTLKTVTNNAQLKLTIPHPPTAIKHRTTLGTVTTATIAAAGAALSKVSSAQQSKRLNATTAAAAASVAEVAAPESATISPASSTSITTTIGGVGSVGGVEDRRVYSPVTFQDVALRSIANSPVKTEYSGRESRSNSTGHAFIHNPSNVFGSLISDTEDFFDDLHSHRGSIGRHVYGSSTSSPAFSPTPPFRTNSSRRQRGGGGGGNGIGISSGIHNASDEDNSSILAGASTSKAAQQLMTLEKRLAEQNTTENGSHSTQDGSDTTKLPRPLSRAAKKAMFNAKQAKAFEKLDKMMEEILENDLPGMCAFNFGPTLIRPPTTSQSDGQICPVSNANRSTMHNQTMGGNMPNSRSFAQDVHQCSCGAPVNHLNNHHHHHNGRNRMHTTACNII